MLFFIKATKQDLHNDTKFKLSNQFNLVPIQSKRIFFYFTSLTFVKKLLSELINQNKRKIRSLDYLFLTTIIA